MNLKTIAFAGLLSLFPIEIAYAQPTSLEDELKELAELAMKCGKKGSYKEYGMENGNPIRYPIDSYSLNVPLNPHQPSKLPFPKTISFHFRDGTVQRIPNQTINQDDGFEIIGDLGKGVEYFSCDYQHNGDFFGHGCGPNRFIDNSLEVRLRKAIKFIKENVSPECYGNRV